jgi:hypothetical protein
MHDRCTGNAQYASRPIAGTGVQRQRVGREARVSWYIRALDNQPLHWQELSPQILVRRTHRADMPGAVSKQFTASGCVLQSTLDFLAPQVDFCIAKFPIRRSGKNPRKYSTAKNRALRSSFKRRLASLSYALPSVSSILKYSSSSFLYCSSQYRSTLAFGK